jgi:hypothetical protein
MADNPEKRAIVNRALAILVGGRTAQTGLAFTSIDNTEFADWTTVSEQNQPDKRLACMLYEDTLKEVLQDIHPDFACEYADLGQVRAVNQEFGGWDYLFELPTDFLCLVKQCTEGNPLGDGFDCEVLDFQGYSHVVAGSDDQSYYCSTDHTSADDASNGQPPDDDGNANWTLYSTDAGYGATWAASVAYENDSTGSMLATNHLTDDAGSSAYIRYVAYVQTSSDGTTPGRSDQPAYYPGAFKYAFAVRLAAAMAQDSKDYERRRMLLEEYEGHAKPRALTVQNRHKARTGHVTVFERRTRG